MVAIHEPISSTIVSLKALLFYPACLSCGTKMIYMKHRKKRKARYKEYSVRFELIRDNSFAHLVGHKARQDAVSYFLNVLNL